VNANPAAASVSSALAPVVVDLVVPCPPSRAFDYFTRDIGRWWPLETHSVGRDRAEGVRFEPRVGGRLVETLADGREATWGTVEAWQHAQRLRFSWHPGRDASTAQWVEVTFAANPAGTRVTLQHCGWERLDAKAIETRDHYVGGWAFVLGERFGGYCTAATKT
jgi:hypothetical protein